MLNDLINPLQGSFVPGRRAIDNVIIVQEIVHSLNLKKGSVGTMVIKIDLEKAFDHLEWGFIRKMLLSFNFPDLWVNLILSCISSSSSSVLFNGGKTENFWPSRGIRQGDPLSLTFSSYALNTFPRVLMRPFRKNLGNPSKLLVEVHSYPTVFSRMTSFYLVRPPLITVT
ncbi:hypothetical protein RHSIM_Rhsim07G0234500 [Rhododendron simsii]|uniref:Reverse transcriptase domain-containing protein n=1 Tax=Rhododendron simsii TaxID=118357 RepID=A0A834GM02_RHOSS|nr:hypothetical protein RHSIM_Rhsim07G0234500 [Rhododendron simsii]